MSFSQSELNVKTAIHKLRHLFSDHSRPLTPPPCHLVSSFDIPQPTPLSDNVIYERENDMSMID